MEIFLPSTQQQLEYRRIARYMRGTNDDDEPFNLCKFLERQGWIKLSLSSEEWREFVKNAPDLTDGEASAGGSLISSMELRGYVTIGNVIFYNPLLGHKQKRFTLAHEAAHLMLCHLVFKKCGLGDDYRECEASYLGVETICPADGLVERIEDQPVSSIIQSGRIAGDHYGATTYTVLRHFVTEATSRAIAFITLGSFDTGPTARVTMRCFQSDAWRELAPHNPSTPFSTPISHARDEEHRLIESEVELHDGELYRHALKVIRDPSSGALRDALKSHLKAIYDADEVSLDLSRGVVLAVMSR